MSNSKSTEAQTDQQLKTDVSVELLHFFAHESHMTFDGYCAAYDRERHERLLNKIMRPVLKDREKLNTRVIEAITEDNLAMLTYLMDEKSEPMYKGDGTMKDGKWLCDTATHAVSMITIENEGRKLIAALTTSTKKDVE